MRKTTVTDPTPWVKILDSTLTCMGNTRDPLTLTLQSQRLPVHVNLTREKSGVPRDGRDSGPLFSSSPIFYKLAPCPLPRLILFWKFSGKKKKLPSKGVWVVDRLSIPRVPIIP